MEQIYPEQRRLDPEEIYSDLEFPQGTEGRPFVAVNMVTSVDGKATTLAGKAYGLGSRVDRMTMRNIRVAVDAVMNGAETLRQENVNPWVPDGLEAQRVRRGLSPQPLALTLSSSLNLPLERTFFQTEGRRPVVITGSSAPAEKREAVGKYADLLYAGEYQVDLREMMRLLVEMLGVHRLLVEGGPSLNAELFTLGMVDELFWTVSPRIIGGRAQKTMVEEDPLAQGLVPRLRLLQVHQHESELYLRYSVERQG